MSPLLQVLGMTAASALATLAVVAGTQRSRAIGALAALAVTPVLLVAEIWDSPQFASLRDHPPVAVALAVAVVLAVAGGGLLLRERPELLGVLALAAVPFRIPVQSGGATANLLVPLYVVVGVGVVAWALPRLRVPAGAPPPTAPPSGWLERVLVGLVVLYAVGSAWSIDRHKALEQVVFFYVPFALLFVVLRDLRWTQRLRRRAFGVLVCLALVLAGIGYVEYATRTLLLNPKVIASNQFEPYFRVNSLFFDPNIYGRFLVLVMLGLAAVLLWERRDRRVVAAAVALALLWGGLVLTLSQSSFGALLAGLAVLALLRFRARFTLAAIGAGAAVVLTIAIAAPHSIGLGGSRSVNDATSGRGNLIAGGVRLAAARPLLGFGSGSFSRQFRRHESSSRARAQSASHTIPITVAAEQGAVGLAAYIALLVAALGRLLRGARARPERALVAAAFVALVVHTWMYAAFLEDPMTWVLLAVGTALAREP